jgi:hypothetical protein
MREREERASEVTWLCILIAAPLSRRRAAVSGQPLIQAHMRGVHPLYIRDEREERE